jgi:hypothetical protein
MKRFKIIYKFKCPKGHENVSEQVLRVQSKKEIDREVVLKNFPKTACRYCSGGGSHRPTSLQILGVEELPGNPVYGCMGYICPKCGERVTVFRIESETGIDPPPFVAVACTQGHKRKIDIAAEIGNFIHWEEKNN